MHLIHFTPAILLVLASIGSARPAIDPSITVYDVILGSGPAFLVRDNLKAPKAINKCGPKNKNKKCDDNECCSGNGFCGTNKNFCGLGCQEKFGRCVANTKVEDSERRCGPDHDNQKCLGVDCCSASGFCGIGAAYCAVPQECQRAFGRCDSDMFPIGASTLKDPRPQLGQNEYGKYIMDCKLPGTIAMTFDDGPNVYTGELLDKLRDAGAKATFFVGGNNNGRQVDQGQIWPALVDRMYREGHQIASHTWSHPHMNAIKTEQRKLEMAKTERAIANIIGQYPTYMRPPYSQCDEQSGCQNDMKEMGYALVGAPFDTLDWQNLANIESSITRVKQFFDGLTSESHAIVCQHDFLGASVERLTPVVLAEIKAKNLKAVTVGDCLGDPIENWYRSPGNGSSWFDKKPTTLLAAVADEPWPDMSDSEHSEPDHFEFDHPEPDHSESEHSRPEHSGPEDADAPHEE